MEKAQITVDRRQATIFLPEGKLDCPIVYTHISAGDAETVALLLDDIRIILVAIEGVDWETDLSPWPAPKAFRGGADFTGDADTYLKELTESILPAIEAYLSITPDCRILAGYSLAGLFAIYALYRTELFSRVASVSGSLWYDGFSDFININIPLKLPERVYYSLGDRESTTKNHRMARVEQCTREAEQRMEGLGVRTIFELNFGNHFADAAERIAKGIRWLLQ